MVQVLATGGLLLRFRRRGGLRDGRAAGAGGAAEAGKGGDGGGEAVERVDGRDEVGGGVEGLVACFALLLLGGAVGLCCCCGAVGSGSDALAGRAACGGAGAVGAPVAVLGRAAAGEELEGSVVPTAGGFGVGGLAQRVVWGRATGEGYAGWVFVLWCCGWWR